MLFGGSARGAVCVAHTGATPQVSPAPRRAGPSPGLGNTPSVSTGPTGEDGHRRRGTPGVVKDRPARGGMVNRRATRRHPSGRRRVAARGHRAHGAGTAARVPEAAAVVFPEEGLARCGGVA